MEEIETPLGIEEKETKETRPCFIQNVSIEEQQTYYGRMVRDGLKMHLQGKTEGFEYVEYGGRRYNVVQERYFRRGTVLYLERSGHSG